MNSSKTRIGVMTAAFIMMGCMVHPVSGVPQLERKRWKYFHGRGKKQRRPHRKTQAQRYHAVNRRR